MINETHERQLLSLMDGTVHSPERYGLENVYGLLSRLSSGEKPTAIISIAEISDRVFMGDLAKEFFQVNVWSKESIDEQKEMLLLNIEHAKKTFADLLEDGGMFGASPHKRRIKYTFHNNPDIRNAQFFFWTEPEHERIWEATQNTKYPWPSNIVINGIMFGYNPKSIRAFLSKQINDTEFRARLRKRNIVATSFEDLIPMLREDLGDKIVERLTAGLKDITLQKPQKILHYTDFIEKHFNKQGKSAWLFPDGTEIYDWQGHPYTMFKMLDKQWPQIREVVDDALYKMFQENNNMSHEGPIFEDGQIEEISESPASIIRFISPNWPGSLWTEIKNITGFSDAKMQAYSDLDMSVFMMDFDAIRWVKIDSNLSLDVWKWTPEIHERIIQRFRSDLLVGGIHTIHLSTANPRVELALTPGEFLGNDLTNGRRHRR